MPRKRYKKIQRVLEISSVRIFLLNTLTLLYLHDSSKKKKKLTVPMMIKVKTTVGYGMAPSAASVVGQFFKGVPRI